MESLVLERLLNKENIAINEMIQIVKNNPIFQETMGNFKEQFFIKDRIHGISHNERVALLACYIGVKEGLNNEELRLVLEAAKYHDIGRGYEVNHGQMSATLIDRNKGYIFPNLNDDEINIVKALCHGHSVDDKKYEEIARLYGISDIEKFKRFLDIVKDADALDRVRLPRFGQLDEKYLRTETSKDIIDVSRELFSEYRTIQRDLAIDTQKENNVESNYELDDELRRRILFDGENYYLLRSLNKTDVENLDSENGIVPKINNTSEYTVQDVMAQIRYRHRKTNLISLSEDPNIVLTYNQANLHRYALIKLSREEIENSERVFSAGEYLLGVIESQIENIAENAPENVKQILERIDNASSTNEVVRIINGADRQVQIALVEKEQQYLSEEEQLDQSKKIAKCKILNYYGLMRDITTDEKGKALDISGFTQIMRSGYSSSEWLYSGKIEQEKIIGIPQILVDGLALVKQAEFQGKDRETLKTVEQEILKLATSGTEINQDVYQVEYSSHDNLRTDLTIDRAYEITNGQISYRDANMQITAIRILAEMTLNKRKITELLQERLPNINVKELLANTYCVNSELITRQNNRGKQIGKSINFIISDYGYDMDNETSIRILRNIENLKDEQLISIIYKGLNAPEISDLLIKTRENDERIQSTESKRLGSKYIAEAIVEGYNWKRDGNVLTRNEKELLANKLLQGVTKKDELYKLYKAINNIQIGDNKFTQNDVFAIMINLAIDRRIGDIPYSELVKKDFLEIQTILLNNQEGLQTSVLPISIDLLAGRGKEINNLKKELIDLGLDKEFIESKDIKNVYVAKKIVEEYDFGREISLKEKASLIKAVLNNSDLNNNKFIYLTTLIQNIEKIGLNTQEIYGMIINSAVNEKALEEKGYGYNVLLMNENNACQTIEQYKDKIQTKVTEGTIDVAVSENLNETEQQQIKFELVELGIDNDFIETKDIKNVYVAKRIVEEYDFGREISSKEKASLIRAVLNNRSLNNNETCYLATLIQNIEKIGLNAQEIYGMIINSAVNESAVLGEASYSYSVLLPNTNHACQTIKKYKNKIQTQVTEGTVNVAVSENLNEAEQKKIKSELVELGIDNDFIETKDIKNVYIAKKIVEEYDFGREISSKEKASLIRAVLNNRSLNNNETCYLATLIQNIEKIGLNAQEIYGMIINSAVNEKALKEKGYGYSVLLMNENNACQTIEQYKDKIQTQVTEGTIDVAMSENLNETEQTQIKAELVELGIDNDFIESKDIKNVYAAKKIIEEYDFGREISSKEKASLIRAILNSSCLNNNRTYYLTSLIQNIEQIGLNTQEIYGMIINSAVNGKALEEKGYSYSLLLNNKNNVCQTIEQYKDKIQTTVTEETILKAVKKADKPKKIKGQDIAKATIELTGKGNGGSEVCDAVQADYTKLLDEKARNTEKEGSEQDVSD